MKMSTSIIGVVLLAMITAGCGRALAVDGRRSIDLDPGWKFIRKDVPGAAKAAFDDANWSTVNIPHTWNAIDGADGPPAYYRGPGWYRRHLSGPAVGLDQPGTTLVLRFNAACSVADVFVNGKPAGEHKGAFAAFNLNVTNLINRTGDNVIAVRVDNAKRPDVPPLAGDFTMYGGLYRSVSLMVLNDVSINPFDDGSPGVFIRQSHVSDASATVSVTTELRNADSQPKPVSVRVDVIDANGQVVTTATSPITIPASGTTSVVNPLSLDHPHLWNGVKGPYLYHARITVLDGGKQVDAITQPLGLRTFHVDPNKGLFLNGKHYALHGVNRHQDWKGNGWAISPAEQTEDFNLIMEMGCTGIRLSHYQHAQIFYNLCDKGGLVVWAESCMVNKVTDSPAFDATAEQQLRELIKQNYNHPSIIFWSLYNELGAKHGSDQDKHQLVLVQKLNDIAHHLDPDRITTAASNHPDRRELDKITDVIAFNNYDGWYSGSPTKWPKTLDKEHAEYPNDAIGISEYGAGASIHQHEANPTKPKTSGKWHPEEWQCIVHEHAWAAMEKRPYLWGTFLWTMFDFGSDSRHEGDHMGINDKGLVTYDRKVKKDAFFFYKANWTTDPFVHINDRRFTPRREANLPVKIYANTDSVTLKLNGNTIGTIEGKSVHDHIFIFKNVKMHDGSNTLAADGTADGKTVSDQCTITVSPKAEVHR